LKLAALVVGGLLLGVLAGVLMIPGALDRVLPTTGLSIGQAAIGGPFSLVDHTGKPVTDKDFRGRFLLIYFGFTFCPDVCPAGLQVASAAIEKLGKKGGQVVPIFITVDPERDTVEQMASYVSSFHPRLIGLTGTPEQLASAAKVYRVYYRKVKDEKSSAPYTVDHSSIFYFMDPDGKFLTHFTHATPVDKMAETMAKYLR
jgi:protein SCO1/2